MTAKHWIRRIVFSVVLLVGLVLLVLGWSEGGQEWTYYLKLALVLLTGAAGLASTFLPVLDQAGNDQRKQNFSQIAGEQLPMSSKAGKLAYRGYCAWCGNRMDTAYHYLRRAERIAQDPAAKARVQLLIGRVALEEKKPARAEEYFRRAVENDPSYDGAWSNLGSVSASAGQMREAVQCWERALFYNPRNYFAASKLGEAAMKQGDLEKALAWFERAAREAPGEGMLWMNCAVALSKLGRREEAMARYRQAVAAGYRDPDGRVLASLELECSAAGEEQTG